MGVYLSSPITEKISADEKCSKFTYGASSMQGWRMSQEDAHNCVPEFEEDTSLFAVYDGHGGAEVAQYCALHLPDYIKHTQGYKDGRLDDGLQDAFLGFDATLMEPNAIRELKTIAGVEEEDEENKAGVFPASQNERDLLLAEANMPLEVVLAQYDGVPNPPCQSLGIKNSKHQFQSPMIRPKGASHFKAGGDTWSTSTITSEADSTKSSHEEDTKSARVSLDSKLANGHADNDNNLNIEKEISQSFPSVSIIVQDEDGNDVTDDQSNNADIPTSTTGPTDGNTPSVAKPSCDASSTCNLPSSTTPSEGASSSVDTGCPSSSDPGDNKAQPGFVSSNVADIAAPSDIESGKDAESSSVIEANSSSSSKMELASSIKPNCSSEPSTQPMSTSGSNTQPGPSSGSSTQPDPSSESSIHQEPHCGSSTQSALSSGSSAQQESSHGSSAQQEPSSGSSTQPGSSSGPRKDLQECGSSGEAAVAGSSSGLSMLVNMEDDSDDDSEDYEGSSDDEMSEEEEEEESDDGELEEIEGALTKDPMMDKQEEEPGSDSGCTAVVAIIKGRQLVVANAGDSRCVLCRDGKAVELSFDHKPEDLPEQQRIERAGGKVTMDGRVNGGLNLSRAIGDHCYKKNEELPAKDQMITAFPDIQSTTLGREDEFIVLACDGIWNYLNSQEVVDFVRKKLSNSEYNETPSKICEEMFDHCLAPNTMGDGTGCDNMTCIVILLDEKFRASGPFVAELEPVKSGPLKRDATQIDTMDQESGQVEKKRKLSTEDEEKMEVANSTDLNNDSSEVKTEFNQLNEREVIKCDAVQTDSGVSADGDCIKVDNT